jgi:hypothetical protein
MWRASVLTPRQGEVGQHLGGDLEQPSVCVVQRVELAVGQGSVAERGAGDELHDDDR